MCKCLGCGVKLQNTNKDNLGFTYNISNKLCERCFRIKNYNEYKFVNKDNDDYINILNNINDTNDLVLLVVDLFNISKDLNDIGKYISNDVLLVLTKRDLLPKSCNNEKLKKYFSQYKINILDTIIISSKKNYNMDELLLKINKYKRSTNVYVVGFTNSGKSTMINKIIYNYSKNDINITTSNLPSTTIDCIELKINDNLTLIDTPGLLDLGDVTNYVSSSKLKKIIPIKEIKPITYQVKDKRIISIEDILWLDVEKNNVTIYASNSLNIKKCYKNVVDITNLNKFEFVLDNESELVIQGLCFLKFTNKGKVNVYIRNGIEVFVRKKLI